MTGRSSARKYLKGTRRMTPYDVRAAGTFAETRPPERPPARGPTPEERHADNYAKVELGRRIGRVRELVPAFEEELAEMNRGKVGRPFEFADGLILWMMSLMTVVNGDYRLIAGLAESVLGAFGVAAPSYTRFLERCHMLCEDHLLAEDSRIRRTYGGGVLSLRVYPDVIDRVRRAGVDSTALNLSCANLWRRTKWGSSTRNRGWLHFHVLADLDTGEVIAYAVTDESVGDAPMLRLLVDEAAEAGHRIGRIYADGAYSTDANWIHLTRENGYEFVTSFRSNTVPRKKGCEARGLAAELWCGTPYHVWTRMTGYHFRWKSETVFSDFKEMFLETVSATSVQGMMGEAGAKVRAFNDYKKGRAELLKVTGNGVTVARSRGFARASWARADPLTLRELSNTVPGRPTRILSIPRTESSDSTSLE